MFLYPHLKTRSLIPRTQGGLKRIGEWAVIQQRRSGAEAAAQCQQRIAAQTQIETHTGLPEGGGGGRGGVNTAQVPPDPDGGRGEAEHLKTLAAGLEGRDQDKGAPRRVVKTGGEEFIQYVVKMGCFKDKEGKRIK